MKWRSHRRNWVAGFALLSAVGCSLHSVAQTAISERSFPQSKAIIEKALKEIHPSMSGRLPVLEGFALAVTAEHHLEHYQRGYYEATAQVTASGSGPVVRVSAKVTAWYNDTSSSHSGYELLKSNGRIEAAAEPLALSPLSGAQQS